MPDEKHASLLTFPTEFVIKVMGRSDADFKTKARAIIEKHVGALDDERIRERASSNSRFVGFSFTIHADSREQLDNIYRDLSACPDVLMAL